MFDDYRDRLPQWEEQAERRLGILEKKMDDLLDPQTGIYSKLSSIEGKLQRWAIAILTAILMSLLTQIVLRVVTIRHS